MESWLPTKKEIDELVQFLPLLYAKDFIPVKKLGVEKMKMECLIGHGWSMKKRRITSLVQPLKSFGLIDSMILRSLQKC